MSKFKKGDRIRRVSNFQPWAPEGYEAVVLDGYEYVTKNGRVSETSIVDDQWELVRSSPIREKTVKEIVPGTYGIVMVKNGQNGNAVDIWLNGSEATGMQHWYTASELRDAARIFTDLAAYLESKEEE